MNTTFIDRVTEVALSSEICCQVLLSADNYDLEFRILRPAQIADAEPPMSAAEFTARRLRSVGFVGMSGLTPRSAWKEALPSNVIVGIGTAFSAYVESLFPSLREKVAERVEISMLHALYELRDTRNDC